MSAPRDGNDMPPDKPGLSPPWITLQRQLSSTIGQSSQVMVSQVTGDSADYEIKVITFDKETAVSLANVVKGVVSFGNVTVRVSMMDRDGKKYGASMRTPSVEDVKRALLNNPLVYDVDDDRKIACAPVVVQYWNDDISNPDGFSSMLASEAFKKILGWGVDAYTMGRKLSTI